MQNPRIEELVRRDDRYAPEAYDFVYDALAYSAKRTGRTRPEPDETDEHVSVLEFFDGVRELAVREFGLMAPTVFRAWGVHRTDDFGEIIRNLIDAGLVDPAAADDRDAFHEVMDLQDGLVHDYRIEAGESLEELS